MNKNKKLRYTDFIVKRLSIRLGLLKFKSYTRIDDSENNVCYNVICASVLTKRQVSIIVDGNINNEHLLKQLSEKSSSLNKIYIDFENCIIGHCCEGKDFVRIIQTYQAEKILIVNIEKNQNTKKENLTADYSIGCIENNFNCLNAMKRYCFESYYLLSQDKKNFCLNDIKDVSHAIYNNLYLIFKDGNLTIEKEKEIEKRVQDELLEIANFIIECDREKFYEETKLKKK